VQKLIATLGEKFTVVYCRYAIPAHASFAATPDDYPENPSLDS